MTGKWLFKERALLYQYMMGLWKGTSKDLLRLLLLYSRNPGPSDFIRRWHHHQKMGLLLSTTFIRRWDYPDALLLLFTQRQLKARSVMPSPTQKYVYQLFPTMQDILQKHPGLPQPTVLLIWPLLKGEKIYTKWKRNGKRVIESKNQASIWKKKKIHYGGEEGSGEITVV